MTDSYSKGRNQQTLTKMFLKDKTCPHCSQYKLMWWSPARMTLYLLAGSVITVCIPILGLILLIPIILADIVLIPTAIILYLIPRARRLELRCWSCKWHGAESLAVQT